jgi:hypothetical protein
MVPTNTHISASVRSSWTRPGIGQGAAFYTYGCEVSVSDKDRNHLQMVKGVDVYTHERTVDLDALRGSTGLGTSKQKQTG